MVPRSRLGSKSHAVVRLLWSRSSGAVTGWMKTSRFFSRGRVAAVGAGRQLVQLLDGRLAAGGLVAVRRAGDPRERRPGADLSESLAGRRGPVDDPAPECLVVAPGVEVGDVAGCADHDVVERRAEHAGAFLHDLRGDPLARGGRVAVDRVDDRLHVGHELAGLLGRRGGAGQAVTGGAAAQRRAEERIVAGDVRVELDAVRATGRLGRRAGGVGDRQLTAHRVCLVAVAVGAEGHRRWSPGRPDGQAGSATGAPLTGFSGTGGL